MTAYYALFFDVDETDVKIDKVHDEISIKIGETAAMRNMEAAEIEKRLMALYSTPWSDVERAAIQAQISEGGAHFFNKQREGNAMPMVQTVHFLYDNGEQKNVEYMSDEEKIEVMEQLQKQIKAMKASEVKSKVLTRRLKDAEETLQELVDLFDSMEEDED